jgi:hypothetical protein
MDQKMMFDFEADFDANGYHEMRASRLGIMWETRLGNQRTELWVESENNIIG